MKNKLGRFLVAWLLVSGSVAFAQTAVIEVERVMTAAEGGTVGPSVIERKVETVMDEAKARVDAKEQACRRGAREQPARTARLSCSPPQ